MCVCACVFVRACACVRGCERSRVCVCVFEVEIRHIFICVFIFQNAMCYPHGYQISLIYVDHLFIF